MKGSFFDVNKSSLQKKIKIFFKKNRTQKIDVEYSIIETNKGSIFIWNLGQDRK